MSEFFWIAIYPLFIVGFCLLSPIVAIVLMNLIVDFFRGRLPNQRNYKVDKDEISEIR